MQSTNMIDVFEIVKFVVEIILTVVAVAISIVALLQTKTQIQLSNKQLLFERRLKNYSIVNELLYTYKEFQYKPIQYMNDEQAMRDIKTVFHHLLDGSVLREIRLGFDTLNTTDANEEIITHSDKLLSLSEELPIIFKCDAANIVSDFVAAYVVLVFRLTYIYNIINSTSQKQKESIDFKQIDKDFEELSQVYDKVNTSHAMEELLKEIKL